MGEQQGELQKMMTQLEEAKNLEAEERRRQEEEIRAKAEEIEEIRAVVEAKERETQELQEEVDVSKQKLEETAQSLAASMAIAQEVQQRAAEVVSSSSSSCSEEAITDIPDIIVDPVEDREVGMDADMTNELEELGKDLETARNEEEESEETKQFRDLLGSGTDKYKTLREVRKGNTKRRIDNFENM